MIWNLEPETNGRAEEEQETASTRRRSASIALTICKKKCWGNKDQLAATGLVNGSTKWNEPLPTQSLEHILIQTFTIISNMNFTES